MKFCSYQLRAAATLLHRERPESHPQPTWGWGWTGAPTTHSLLGEGDLIRHLGFLGYKLTYSQSSDQEYDYNTTNLATDLRDGVRLCRMVRTPRRDSRRALVRHLSNAVQPLTRRAGRA